MCGTRIAENTGCKNDAKNRHLGTIAQLCRAISSQLSMYRQSDKNIKQQYVLHMSPQYGKLRPMNGWDPLASLGHTSKFQRVSSLAFITAVTSLTDANQTLHDVCLLGCYTTYTFLAALALWWNFARCKIHFGSIYAPSHKFVRLYVRN